MKKNKTNLVGRDPTHGKTQGRAGPHKTKKDKLKDRKSKETQKYWKKELG